MCFNKQVKANLTLIKYTETNMKERMKKYRVYKRVKVIKNMKDE